MKIEFYRSKISKIDNYTELYRRCFQNFPKERNQTYFKWLYGKNPLGEYIGIDAVDIKKGLHIGQVGGIPFEFNYCGKKIKVLQAIQICLDKNYRGNGIFGKMATRLEDYAKEKKFSLIITIANKMAKPAWQHTISMKYLAQLDVLLGYGSLGLDKLQLSNDIFCSIWDKNRIYWRKENPFNKGSLLKKNKIKLTSPSVLSLFEVFSFIDNKDFNLNFDRQKFKILPSLFIGLAPKYIKNVFYFRIPEFIKPSPLNFLYKDISNENIILYKKKCYFTYLDFDAY